MELIRKGDKMIEIRFHGRGGQGAVTSAELLAHAAIREGRYAQAFPSFGPERRGAPVLAFVRVSDDEPIRVRFEVLEPDVVVVLDPTLLGIVDVMGGLKKRGVLVLNARNSPAELRSRLETHCRIAAVDATSIAREVLGLPITNTTMLGALVKGTGIVNLESLKGALQDRFGRLAERNIKAMETAYEKTVIEEG